MELRYRVKSIVAGPGTNKSVNLSWFARDDQGQEYELLNDQIAVPAQATNEEIVGLIEHRRDSPDISGLRAKVPNPEENQDLVGLEG